MGLPMESILRMGKIWDWYNIMFPGWWYAYPSEKYESQLGLLFPIYGKS